jgi:hypothetical protein
MAITVSTRMSATPRGEVETPDPVLCARVVI